MYPILQKIFLWSRELAARAILEKYKTSWYCIVDYLYFANIYGKRVFDVYSDDISESFFQDAVLDDYKKAPISSVRSLYQSSLMHADFLLPDGIALQIFTYLALRRWPSNLNGTDFAPYFLEYLVSHVVPSKIRILLYGTYPHLLQQTKLFLEKKWYQVVFAQDWYSCLDLWVLESSLSSDHWYINVLLVARTTPLYPIQEIWSYVNRALIKKYRLLVMNQWGTFDFWVWAQKRAPGFCRFLKIEWLRRLISDPKRNYKKVLDSLWIIPYVFSYLLLKKRSR